MASVSQTAPVDNPDPFLGGPENWSLAQDHPMVKSESWRVSFRAMLPHLPTCGLEALLIAMRKDDPRLTQGSTTTPPPLECVRDWPVEAACGLAYIGWKGEGLDTVGDVEQFFARVCFLVDWELGAAECRHFLNWFDDNPRPVVFRELSAEVAAEIERREAVFAHVESLATVGA